MSTNPLFPDNPDEPPEKTNPAVELIRAKVAAAFVNEPNAAQEIQEAEVVRTPSKHQKYMRELADSGKSLAEIQTEWHHYYITLSDAEKREVWQEFYDANQHTPYQKLFQKQQQVASRRKLPVATPEPSTVTKPKPEADGIVVADHQAYAEAQLEPDLPAARKLKTKIVKRVSANGKLKAKHHVQSVLFGLGMGFLVICIFLFTFFNNAIIAPFIQPSRDVSATPIIVGGQIAKDAPASIIIPKINIQIPIDFSLTSDAEAGVLQGLQNGVVHYPSTVLPGQNGNAAYFGHSSEYIFNNGKYKFAFVLLHRLTTGDIFYITYHGTVYAYQVFHREIVPPTQVSVLNETQGKQATAMLITCDPPGFNINRLVVWGEQISPNPATNTTAPANQTVAQPKQIASDGTNRWSRFVNWLEFWN